MDKQSSLELLNDKHSPKRRTGAKHLRKLKDSSAGPALLAALQKEVQDPRTWETQYQMIMALGECGYTPALPYLHELARHAFEATMVYVAIGDATVRLEREHENDATPVLRLMETGNEMLIDGAFRAVAMLRMKPEEEAIHKIVRYGALRQPDDGLRFWIAAAAAGWSSAEVTRFLAECARGSREDVRQAAIAAQQGKYRKWNPL
jgi:HEAT repeat protein